MPEQGKTVSGVFDERTPKKHSVRFDTEDDGAPLASLYVPKDVLMQIDRLEKGSIRVTIEAA